MSLEPSDDLVQEEAPARRLVHQQRLWPAAWVWPVVLVLVVVVVLVSPSAIMAVVGVVALLGVVAFYLVGAGIGQRRRVLTDAMLVGPTVRRRRVFEIPMESIDPQTVRYHQGLNHFRFHGPKLTPVAARFAPFVRHGVEFTGLAPRLAQQHEGRIVPVAYPTMVTTWVLGTSRPEQLLRAMEEGLVASGWEEARGLADRALASPVVDRVRRL